jgi:hypothetical protein
MPAAILRENFKTLGLSQDAADMLLQLWGAAQFFDDCADGGRIKRADLNRTLWDCLVGIQLNRFYAANSALLIPVIATAIMKWQGSDTAERRGVADARSYMWRAGFYDIVLLACIITNGPEIAAAQADTVMAIYGETLADYLGEFPSA